jgi:hypothetical protein
MPLALSSTKRQQSVAVTIIWTRDVLKAEGITEFTGYAVDATAKPLTDLYVGVCPPDFRTQIENAAAFKTKSAPAKAPEPVVATSEVKHAQPVFKAFDLKTADGVTELSFKDPNHYNALGISFWTELPAAIEWLVGTKSNSYDVDTRSGS